MPRGEGGSQTILGPTLFVVFINDVPAEVVDNVCGVCSLMTSSCFEIINGLGGGSKNRIYLSTLENETHVGGK